MTPSPRPRPHSFPTALDTLYSAPRRIKIANKHCFPVIAVAIPRYRLSSIPFSPSLTFSPGVERTRAPLSVLLIAPSFFPFVNLGKEGLGARFALHPLHSSLLYGSHGSLEDYDHADQKKLIVLASPSLSPFVRNTTL